MLFLKLALLNIRKYRRRSTIIVVSVMLSVIVMVFVGGMVDGLRKSFFSELLQESGHLQIHEQGWSKRLNPYSIKYLIDDPNKVIAELKGIPSFSSEAVRTEPILHFGALLVNGDRNVAMVGQGVEPGTGFFDRVRNGIVQGRFLTGGAAGGVALSRSTASLLKLKLGDQVVVLVQDSSGSPYYLSYPLTGIFHSGVSEIDDTYFFLTLGEAQRLLDLPNRASEIRVRLNDANGAAPIAARIEPLLKKAGLGVETWRQINGSLIVLIDEFGIFSLIINLFIVIVAATVITNSILMTVFERIAMFGTLRAIGLKRRQLFWMIVDEGFILGVIGGLLGLAVGASVVVYFQIHGINVGAMSSAFGTATTYHTAMTPRNVLLDFLGGVLIAAGGSLYGAWVSSRTRLVESLQDQGT